MHLNILRINRKHEDFEDIYLQNTQNFVILILGFQEGTPKKNIIKD